MKIALWILFVIAYLFIGFWVAYFLYRKTDLDFKATTNILLWPIISVLVGLLYILYCLGKLLNFISGKIERLFERLRRSDYVSKRKF